MPTADAVLLPLCVALSVLGVVAVAVSWRRGNRGRLIQAVGLVLAPVALYFTGLLRLVWNAVVAIGRWAVSIVWSPAIWFGLSLLGLCVVLWLVGGFVARRSPGRKAVARKTQQPAVATTPRGRAAVPARAGAATTDDDDDMAEIEALLKSRGIQ